MILRHAIFYSKNNLWAGGMNVKKILVFFVVVFLVLVYASADAVVVLDCNNGGRYEDMGDGTVQDCRTGLIWLKNAACTDASNGIAGGSLTWYDAMKWVAGLGNGPCGLTDGSSAGDWRLPTKTEWMAMVAYGKKMGYNVSVLTNAAGTGMWTTNGDAFNNVQLSFTGYYWSSTANASYADNGWYVYMVDGTMGYCHKGSYAYVLPVRGGQSGEFGSLIIQ